MRISAVVADTRTHAAAMIAWIGLDPQIWVPLAYGDRLTNIYENVKIVRPLGGVDERHRDWILEVLLPRVGRRRETVPSSWEPLGSEDRDREPTGYASAWPQLI